MRKDCLLVVTFYIRQNKNTKRDFGIYCCIKIKGSDLREICVSNNIRKQDWDLKKGRPKQNSDALVKLSIYLETIRARLFNIYLDLKLSDDTITAGNIKSIYLGNKTTDCTILQLIDQSIKSYEKELAPGSLKNYSATRYYVESFCKLKYKSGDIPLKFLTSAFIHELKTYILTYPIKSNTPCTNNGCMKHLERVKKIIRWAYEMRMIDRNVFGSFKLKKKRYESERLTWEQLKKIENKSLSYPMLNLVRDLFLFSCYTGIAPIDLQNLKPHQIYISVDGTIWLTYMRHKSKLTANIPLLKSAIALVEKYKSQRVLNQTTVFPFVTNKDLNLNLKMISEICEIGMPLNFYMARHTFATTTTLSFGVPITSIKEMMGHERIESTMNYAKTNSSLIGQDMKLAQEKMDILH